ncbi:putative TIM-barrel fold metal-dependent hydrolase [Mesorhizobium sp. J18]|uniref:amidohydrolase family protein n=1 Tax=Mesorhizobium sp. J18 TaxID=935263 RepID=UPI00119BE451|nr:amidohydrolase family protein [Mesorhizobium sp. J18]TWG96406.1 putative TIM-barrel fold metal-dependent hydrolase [Mesorhizobium sp. J18]
MAVSTNLAGFRKVISRPSWDVPANACDAHMHIVGPLDRFPYRVERGLKPPEATWDDYARVAAHLGIKRCVVVQPSFYATDNDCTLDAVERAGGKARAVVVVDGDVTAQRLRDLHGRGARGIRSQTIAPGGLSLDDLKRLAPLMRDLDWHLQLYVDEGDLPRIAPELRSFGVPLVFDHMAQTRLLDRYDCAGFAELLRLLESGDAWVKLSAAHFEPSAARARLLGAANPERIVWGTDWPHVSYAGDPPDDGALLDVVAEWFDDETVRRRLLVDNPDRLYFSR